MNGAAKLVNLDQVRLSRVDPRDRKVQENIVFDFVHFQTQLVERVNYSEFNLIYSMQINLCIVISAKPYGVWQRSIVFL
jgi:hypothetical protein